MELKDVLKKAYEFEKKGQALYDEVSKTTKNEFVKSIFSYLAEQEKNHITEIDAYIKKNKIDLQGDDAKKTEQFFRTTLSQFKSGLKYAKADTDAYEKGMQMETDAYNYYKEQLPLAKDKSTKDFLNFLMKQENAHHDMLRNAYEFAKDPKHFFAEHERSFFEG